RLRQSFAFGDGGDVRADRAAKRMAHQCPPALRAGPYVAGLGSKHAEGVLHGGQRVAGVFARPDRAGLIDWEDHDVASADEVLDPAAIDVRPHAHVTVEE